MLNAVVVSTAFAFVEGVVGARNNKMATATVPVRAMVCVFDTLFKVIGYACAFTFFLTSWENGLAGLKAGI